MIRFEDLVEKARASSPEADVELLRRAQNPLPLTDLRDPPALTPVSDGLYDCREGPSSHLGLQFRHHPP